MGEPIPGWISYADSLSPQPISSRTVSTAADDTLLLYFTSGTTALPKLVEHSHVSYPIGHLSTMFWLGLQPGDVHLNISSPGWAKHAWSNVFAPWIAGATVFLYNYTRFDAGDLMRVMAENHVTTFCAPPTVWRMLIQADLSALSTPPREVVGAGEPLNPEVIEQVRQAWGVTIRDGFGQTETTLAIGNSPGQPVKEGSMGRPDAGIRRRPGRRDDRVRLVPVDGSGAGARVRSASTCPSGRSRLMAGYHGDDERTAEAMARRLLPHR